jgi:hypothetical protein
MRTKFQQGKIQVYFDGYNLYDFVLLSHYFYTDRLPPHPGYYTIENHSISPIEGIEVVNISDFMAEVLKDAPRLFDLMANFTILKREYSELSRAVSVDFIKRTRR